MNFMEDNIAQKKSNIIGAAITGGASLVGGAINAITQSRQNKLNREAQQKENERSRQWQEEMYNKYSSPAAQVQQRAAAGLNPYSDGAVSSQSVGSVSTGSLPAGQAPAIGESIAAAGGAIGNYIMNRSIFKGYKLDNEQKEVNIQNSYQDLIRKAMENEDYSAVRQYKIDEIKYSSEYAAASLKEKRELIRKARAEADQMEIEAKWKKDADAAGVNPVVDKHIETMNSIDIANKSISLDERRTYFEELKTYSQLALNAANVENLKTKTEIEEFYRLYVQPLEAQTQRIGLMIERENLKGSRIENRYKEVLADAAELQHQLSKGDASGFIEYFNYYLQSFIGLSNVGTKLAGTFAK